MKDLTSWCVDLLAEVSGKGNTLILRCLTGRAVLVSAASASAWLLPPLSFIMGIDQSRGRAGKMDPSWHGCAGRCWSSGEGFAKASLWASLSVTTLANYSLKPFQWRFGMAQSTDSRGVTCICFGREETEKWGSKWRRSCWFRKKTLNTEKLNDPMEYIATVQGNPASKHLVGLPKVKPSQMSITGERVVAKCAR